MEHREVRDFQSFARLVLDEHEEAVVLPWLEDSYRDGPAFWRALYDDFAARGARPPKSRLFQSYDFYHDLVLRHAEPGRVALRWVEDGAWRELGYVELHQACNDRCRSWIELGLEPGQTIALALPVGVELLVSLLSALKLGLIVSYLPPLGDRFLQRRLAALEPEALVIEPLYRRALPDFPGLFLYGDAIGEAGERLESASYPAEAPAARLFPPAEDRPAEPIELSAQALFLNMLRDGVIALSLKPGVHLVDADLHAQQHQPALLLTALLCGATYVTLRRGQLAADPALLDAHPDQVVLLDPAARDALLGAAPHAPETWLCWLRNPADGLDWFRWKDFIEAYGLDEVPVGNLVYDAASGGAILFSLRRRKGLNFGVLPAAGLAWRLADLAPGAQPTLADFGAFALEAEGEAAPVGAILLGRSGRERLYLGTYKPRRAGRALPGDELCAVVEELPFVLQSALVASARGGEGRRYAFALLVFVGAMEPRELEARAPAWTDAARAAIAARLGPDFQPDKILFFPLLVRRQEDGRADQEWCQGQYLSGDLRRKARSPAFRGLALLRQNTLLEPPANAGG